MQLKIIYTALSVAILFYANILPARGYISLDIPEPTFDGNFIPLENIKNTATDDTTCASAVFSNALIANDGEITPETPEIDVETWAHLVFALPDVLRDVLACPEIKNAPDDQTIRFTPIRYTFSNGRTAVINYATQPKVLKQRLVLAEKRDVAQLSNDPSPHVGLDSDAVWTNTDPAWYAIMVTQAGGLAQFVGPDKNNTISTKYIEDHSDDLHPGGMCSDESALARDRTMINRVIKEDTVNAQAYGEKDTNDYYVAGDKNLQWITYAEIAADVAITVVTFGAGAAVTGAAKGARATRILGKLGPQMRALAKTADVTKYLNTTKRLTRATDKLNAIDKYNDVLRQYAKASNELKKLDKVKDGTKYTEKLRETTKLRNQVTKLRKDNEMVEKYAKLSKAEKEKFLKSSEYDDYIKNTRKEINTVNEEIADIRKADTNGNISKYESVSKEYAEVNKYTYDLRALWRARKAKPKQTGNVVARAARAGKTTLKTVKATMGGTKTLDQAARVARQGLKSGKIRDWLFHSTMRNLGALGKAEAAGGLLYGVLKFGLDMYDYTETSTAEYTSGIEFKPLLLLSADDLKDTGQDNVVNHGMWLTWMGDSVSAADDDAAYLQAMDFAEKFAEDLNARQEKENKYPCNVDIYVVRPIIRNPGTPGEQLYYLIMNDEPWRAGRE